MGGVTGHASGGVPGFAAVAAVATAGVGGAADDVRDATAGVSGAAGDAITSGGIASDSNEYVLLSIGVLKRVRIEDRRPFLAYASRASTAARS